MTTVPQRYRRTIQTDGRTAAIPRNAHSAPAAKSHNITYTKCLLVQLILWCLIFFTTRLGQGLGSWNVSVSVSSRTKCPTSRSRLGLGLKGLVHIPDIQVIFTDTVKKNSMANGKAVTAVREMLNSQQSNGNILKFHVKYGLVTCQVQLKFYLFICTDSAQCDCHICLTFAYAVNVKNTLSTVSKCCLQWRW